MKREDLELALAKPLPESDQMVHSEVFDPWDDVLSGIHGSYSSQSDALMIDALEAVRDRKTFDFQKRVGFAAEFALYVLSGHGLTEYGTSPRGAWPDPEFAELWDDLIAKWRAYYEIVWEEPVEKLNAHNSEAD